MGLDNYCQICKKKGETLYALKDKRWVCWECKQKLEKQGMG